MSDALHHLPTVEPWPPPHPIIDAPYGPRWQPPLEAPPPGWVRGPIEPTPRSRRWVAVFVAISLLVAIAGGLLVASFISRQGSESMVIDGEWDPRVAPLAAFVAEAMGTTFVEPIPVQFLTDADFEEVVTQPEASLTTEQQREYEIEEAIGRAFGWYPADLRLFEATNKLNAAGILAFYSFDQNRIVARTTDPDAAALDVELRVTIVHELVHTIQDQRLGGILSIQSSASTPQETEAISALIEGHAVFVEQAYIDALTAADRTEFYNRSAQRGAAIEARVGVVPVMLSLPGSVPYSAGPVLVVAADQSPNGISGLYDKPPIAMDQVLDPRKYFASDRTDTVAPPAPPTTSGVRLTFGTESLGPVRLYATLAGALGADEAWDVTAGWGGDQYIAYRTPETEGNRVCVRWVITGDDTASTERISAALQTWAGQRVSEAAVEVIPGNPTGPQIAVNACDPGTSVAQTMVEQSAGDYFFARSNVLWGLIDRAGDLTSAACAWDTLFDEFPVADLSESGAAVDTRADALIASCR